MRPALRAQRLADLPRQTSGLAGPRGAQLGAAVEVGRARELRHVGDQVGAGFAERRFGDAGGSVAEEAASAVAVRARLVLAQPEAWARADGFARAPQPRRAAAVTAIVAVDPWLDAETVETLKGECAGARFARIADLADGKTRQPIQRTPLGARVALGGTREACGAHLAASWARPVGKIRGSEVGAEQTLLAVIRRVTRLAVRRSAENRSEATLRDEPRDSIRAVPLRSHAAKGFECPHARVRFVDVEPVCTAVRPEPRDAGPSDHQTARGILGGQAEGEVALTGEAADLAFDPRLVGVDLFGVEDRLGWRGRRASDDEETEEHDKAHARVLTRRGNHAHGCCGGGGGPSTRLRSGLRAPI